VKKVVSNIIITYAHTPQSLNLFRQI